MSNRSTQRFGIYGLGQFGYALASHLSSLKGSTPPVVYDRNAEVRAFIATKGTHPRHYAGATLGDVVVADSVADLVSSADILLLSVQSTALVEVLQEIASAKKQDLILVNTAKALASGGTTWSQELLDKGLVTKDNFFVFSGGTIGSELVSGAKLGATLAGSDEVAVREVARMLSSERLYVESSSDVLGTEYAGALKSVVAAFVGFLSTQGFAFGSQTYMTTRLLKEIVELAVAHGASETTFSSHSQCWGNDMWMSALGQTRNRAWGVSLGTGVPSDSLGTVEGKPTAAALKVLFGRMGDSEAQRYPLLRTFVSFAQSEISRESMRSYLDK